MKGREREKVSSLRLCVYVCACECVSDCVCVSECVCGSKVQTGEGEKRMKISSKAEYNIQS